MNSILFNLNRKSFYRSAHWKQSLGIQAVIIFFSIYFSILFLYVGFHIPELFNKFFPGRNSTILFNQFIWVYFLVSALMRQLIQELPVVDIIPLLSQPIKKTRIAKHVVSKSFISFANLIPWFIIIPFATTELLKEYAAPNVWGWILNIMAFVMIDHLTAIFIKRSAPSLQRIIMLLYIVGIALLTISYFNLLPLTEWFGSYLLLVLDKPILCLIPFLLCIPLYLINIKSISQNLYLDAGILPTEKNHNGYSFSWTNKFGQLGTYLSLELKMITRNKRPKTALFSVIFLLAYGFIFYKEEQTIANDSMLVFIGLLTTGAFSISYGQFTPAWHSKYYPFIVSQNIGLKEMLNTQYFLFMGSTAIAYLISTVYLIYGTKILMVNMIMAIFNIGFSSHFVLWMGSFSSKSIDLSQSSFMNFKGTGASQWIISLLIIMGPLIIFTLLKYFIGSNYAFGLFALIGLLGIIFHKAWMKIILMRYQKNKHRMLHVYRQ